MLESYPDVPILLLWDRAPWHRGAAIEKVMQANPRLEIIWFPLAALELDPQEQVWKATRRGVSHNHNQPRLEPLAQQFEEHLITTRFDSSFLVHYGYTTIRAMFISIFYKLDFIHFELEQFRIYMWFLYFSTPRR